MVLKRISIEHLELIIDMNFFKKVLNRYSSLLIIGIVTILIMSPILFKGVPTGFDLPHHYQCSMSYYEGIISGDFYPSWSATRNLGYGGMELRLYPPLSHYSLALFYLVVGNWHIATWLTLTFFAFIGSLGVYLWARELMPTRQAVFAGCVFAVLPYHLTQIYNTFFFAEFVGTAILPFSFYFVVKVCNRGKVLDVIGLAVAYSALILTHLPLTVIGSLCLVFYSLSFLQKKIFFSQIFKLTVAVILGLGSSSFFWVKVIQERELLAKTIIYPDPWLDYRFHFLITPFQSFEGLGLRIYEESLIFYDLMLLCITAVALCGAIPFLIYSKKYWNHNLKGIWWVFLSALFFISPFSRFVWDALPFLQEVQFPWRWMSILCVVGSVISASNFDNLIEWFREKKRPFALMICGVFFAVFTFSVMQLIRPAQYIKSSEFSSLMRQVETDKGVTFWWTIWTRKEAFELKDKILIKDRQSKILKWTPTQRILQISEGQSTEVRIATFYHPNWKVTINGSTINVRADTTGALMFNSPAQSALININFEETAWTKLALFLSCFVWSSFIILGFYSKNSSSRIPR